MVKEIYFYEIQKLAMELVKLSIVHEYSYKMHKDRLFTDNQIRVEYPNEQGFLSIICHEGSYGGGRGLLEFYDWQNEPTGYLDADDCLKIIKKYLKKVEHE